MAPDLRDVTREFARGEATLETLRAAARSERSDRQLAEAVLQLIARCESAARTDSARARARDDLRDRAKQLVPAAPAAPAGSTNRRPPGESIYEAGLRGQRRRP